MDYLILYVLFHCSLPNTGNLQHDLETFGRCWIIKASDDREAVEKSSRGCPADKVIGFQIPKDEARAYPEYFPFDAKYGKELDELEQSITK